MRERMRQYEQTVKKFFELGETDGLDGNDLFLWANLCSLFNRIGGKNPDDSRMLIILNRFIARNQLLKSTCENQVINDAWEIVRVLQAGILQIQAFADFDEDEWSSEEA